MVHIIMGPEGSGKTKMLIDAIHQALKEEKRQHGLHRKRQHPAL